MFLRLLASNLLLHFHDPRHHKNEGPFWKAHGVFTDDRFTVRFHKGGKVMPALRFLWCRSVSMKLWEALRAFTPSGGDGKQMPIDNSLIQRAFMASILQNSW
jgi:hypothetical protein